MPASHGPPVIDLSDLHERAGHDAVLVREVLAEFQPMLETTRREILTALSQSARGELGRLAHRVKGACATVGAASAREHASAVEAAADHEPDVELGVRIETLFSALSSVEGAITSFLETGAK